MKELWDRAKAIFLSTLRTDDEKSQAARYFSMINSVSATDGVFQILTINDFAADCSVFSRADGKLISFIERNMSTATEEEKRNTSGVYRAESSAHRR